MTATGYPQARREEIAEQVHGRLIADPYRWLEDADSEETRSWLAAQDALLAEFMTARPERAGLAARITELLGAGAVDAPVWRGERRFFTRRAAGQEHAVLYTATPSWSGSHASSVVVPVSSIAVGSIRIRSAPDGVAV